MVTTRFLAEGCSADVARSNRFISWTSLSVDNFVVDQR